MNKRFLIILFVLGVLIIAYLFYARYISVKRAEIQNQSTASNAALLQQQTAANEACKKNWFCVASSLLNSAGGAAANIF